MKLGKVNLDDPATTLALLKLKAVVGVTGFFKDDGSLKSIGINCSLCHSTVDNSFTPGIGHRLDGWANHDLNVGAIMALSPDLSAIVNQLKIVDSSIDEAAVRTVLNGWGPGKFDAELLLDGKAVRPDGKPAAVLIPNAFGLLGYNLHTWTADWGGVPYWNALVAVLEMGGIGNFHDPRLDDPQQFPDIAPRFPIAVALKKGHVTVDPDTDRVTKKLPGLHLYQLSLLVPSRWRARISIRMRQTAETSCSTARQNAAPAMWSRSGQNRDGTPTNRRTSGSIISSPSARRAGPTGP